MVRYHTHTTPWIMDFLYPCVGISDPPSGSLSKIKTKRKEGDRVE